MELEVVYRFGDEFVLSWVILGGLGIGVEDLLWDISAGVQMIWTDIY